MLPALGSIAADLGARDPNDRQLVLTAFFGGLTIGQLIYGPISDSTGRKPAMYAGIGCFILGGLICALTQDFTTMVLARILQGFGAAGPRIVAMAMVRDLYAGRAMARIMSFVMAVFILVPILAPSVGQLMLLVANWRAIFYGLVIVGVIDFLWLATRQEETLKPADRVPLSIGHILRSAREALTTRGSLAPAAKWKNSCRPRRKSSQTSPIPSMISRAAPITSAIWWVFFSNALSSKRWPERPFERRTSQGFKRPVQSNT